MADAVESPIRGDPTRRREVRLNGVDEASKPCQRAI
jgi:hypothetical protein